MSAHLKMNPPIICLFPLTQDCFSRSINLHPVYTIFNNVNRSQKGNLKSVKEGYRIKKKNNLQ
jgi:hypothetical protein